MGQLTYTTAEIQALLDSIGTISDLTGFSATDLVSAILELQENVNTDIADVDDHVGDLSSLATTAKGSLVAAVNELFTSASNVKSTIAAAITGAGISTSSSATAATMATNIGKIPAKAREGYLKPYVTNGESITPTGTYATSTYYDTTFGVKIGYTAGGDVLLMMQGGTTTNYEYLQFVLDSTSMSGVTIERCDMSASSNATGKSAVIYGCVLSGITADCTISVTMSTYNSTYDWTQCTIKVTAA